MAILNLGSLNIDHVYRVDHVVRPGETLASDGYEVYAGGKGANQSAALALAGAPVFHAGQVGQDGAWLVDGLAQIGVDVRHVLIDPQHPTGHAVIQVAADSGENAIFLFPGCNHRLHPDWMRTCISSFGAGDIFLSQNEINSVPNALALAAEQGLTVCLNPAPYGPEVADYPLDRVDLLVLNRTEATGLAAGRGAAASPAAAAMPPEDLLAVLRPAVGERPEILLTLGANGAILDGSAGRFRVEAMSFGPVVDTTAAGDTFIGYFLAARVEGAPTPACLRLATAAAAICVTRPGARASIPRRDEVDSIL